MSEFSFITAAEVRDLCRNSQVAAEQFLKQIEQKIVDAAKANQGSYMHHIDAIDVSFNTRLPELEPKLKNACEILKRLGYQVSYTVYGDRYVPRGLQDDDGNGPMYQNCGLKISW